MTVVRLLAGRGSSRSAISTSGLRSWRLLIEEARRRADGGGSGRRGAAALLLVAAGVVVFIGFGGHGGGGAGTAGDRSRPRPAGLDRECRVVAARCAAAGRSRGGFILVRPAQPGDRVRDDQRRLAPAAGVFKTTDGGAHWQATATSWPGGHALTADPRHPGTLYAGTEFAVYKTVDGGRSWRPSHRGLYTPPPADREKGWLIALAVDPANTNIVYAGSDRVSKSTDGGHSWKTVFPPHPTPNQRDVSALAIAPTRPEHDLRDHRATSAHPRRRPRYGRTTIYKSTDAGTTWQATTVVHGSVAPTALAVDPRHPTTVYAAIGANVLKTTNAGKTWQSIAAGLPIAATRGTCHCLSHRGVTALAVDPRRSGTVYAALTQGGIYKTSNGGHTWTRSTARGAACRPCTATRSRSTPHARQRSTPQAKAKPGAGPGFSEAPTAATPGPRPRRGREC